MLRALFGRGRSGRREARGGTWTTLGGVLPRVRTSSGIAVDDELALTFSAVWACSRILVEAIGGLPRVLYERRSDESRQPAINHPLYDVIDVAPNPTTGAVPFWEGRALHQINAGNGFAEIERDGGRVIALWPIHWSRVAATTPASLALEYPYTVRNDDGTHSYLRASELMHLAGALNDDGVWGRGVIPYAREEVGLGIAIRRHGSGYFASGGLPKFVASLPGMKDREARRAYRQEWKEVHNSDSPGEIAIIPVDGKFTPISIPNEAGQFLETCKQNKRTIASYYRIPPYMIGEHDEGAAARASIEAQGIEFVVYALMPWLRKIESELNLKLLTPSERQRYFVEFKLAGLMRGDMKSRMEAYRMALSMGLMTINECRRLENLPSLGAFADTPYMQINMAPVSSIFDAAQSGAGGAGIADAGTADELPAPAGGSVGAVDAWTRGPLAELWQERLHGAAPRRAQSRTAAPDVVQAAARGVLRDAVERMARVEATAIRRKLTHPDFPECLAEFYSGFRAKLGAALTPAARMLQSLGVPVDPQVLADAYVQTSREELAAGATTLSRRQMSEIVDEWARARPDWVIDKALAGEW